MDRGAWCAAVHGAAKSWARLSQEDFSFINVYSFPYLFISLHWVFVAACWLWFPGWAFNPGPLHLGAESFSHWTSRKVLSPTFIF